ncbi:MAG: DUF1302 family protein, partial [Rhodospirillaceae bacterium]|nr:DUF1302 family protein [Rhodospirillaceae bacterium]
MAIAALAVAAVMSAPTGAGAVDFTLDNGVTGKFDTTFTIGAAVRTKGRDLDLVGRVNGGRAFSING